MKTLHKPLKILKKTFSMAFSQAAGQIFSIIITPLMALKQKKSTRGVSLCSSYNPAAELPAFLTMTTTTQSNHAI